MLMMTIAKNRELNDGGDTVACGIFRTDIKY